MRSSSGIYPGPLLFLLYINDISHSTTENILSFADESTVFLSDFDPIRLFSRANNSLEAVLNWLCASNKATQYMVIQAASKTK